MGEGAPSFHCGVLNGIFPYMETVNEEYVCIFQFNVSLSQKETGGLCDLGQQLCRKKTGFLKEEAFT